MAHLFLLGVADVALAQEQQQTVPAALSPSSSPDLPAQQEVKSSLREVVVVYGSSSTSSSSSVPYSVISRYANPQIQTFTVGRDGTLHSK